MNTLDILTCGVGLLNFFLLKIFLMIEYKFLTQTFIRNVTKPTYKETYNNQSLIYLLEFLSFGALVFCVIASYATGNNEGKINVVFIIFFFLFTLIGIFIGEIYYKKIKIPFYKKYYPDEFEEYHVHTIKHRDHYLEEIFINTYIYGFMGLGVYIGYILAFI